MWIPTGDHDQIEELSRLEWLLGEMDTWVDSGILKSIPKRLQDYYGSRRQKVETALGLYFSPFELSEARQGMGKFYRHELLFSEIEKWLASGYINSGYLPAYYACLIELRARLSKYQGFLAFPETDQERLEVR